MYHNHAYLFTTVPVKMKHFRRTGNGETAFSVIIQAPCRTVHGHGRSSLWSTNNKYSFSGYEEEISRDSETNVLPITQAYFAVLNYQISIQWHFTPYNIEQVENDKIKIKKQILHNTHPVVFHGRAYFCCSTCLHAVLPSV